MGHLLFGGSDFVLIFQHATELTLPSREAGTTAFRHLLMVERLGQLRRRLHD
jgi:hypothetical protein